MPLSSSIFFFVPFVFLPPFPHSTPSSVFLLHLFTLVICLSSVSRPTPISNLKHGDLCGSQFTIIRNHLAQEQFEEPQTYFLLRYHGVTYFLLRYHGVANRHSPVLRSCTAWTMLIKSPYPLYESNHRIRFSLIKPAFPQH
ncbi:hypothetical protein ElyMa_006622000 [Elysia marginata]|uniref:Secreted protein n=1 Tax=Elysia marginata TaxID=1093978 RepID=A0AAV4IJU6_9GAST|nr:hypothetical protein ElyMa_006622000 [Elysia marginata]